MLQEIPLLGPPRRVEQVVLAFRREGLLVADVVEELAVTEAVYLAEELYEDGRRR